MSNFLSFICCDPGHTNVFPNGVSVHQTVHEDSKSPTLSPDPSPIDTSKAIGVQCECNQAKNTSCNAPQTKLGLPDIQEFPAGSVQCAFGTALLMQLSGYE